MRVFVNERAVDVPDGATVRDAVAALDPALASLLDHGGQVTDGRGIAIDRTTVLAAGAILRAFKSARRDTDADA